MTRRTALTCAAGVCGSGLIAACGGGSSPNTGDSNSGLGGFDPGGGPAPAKVPGDAPLIALADIEVGSVISVNGPEGRALLVARPTADTAVAFSTVCPHEGCTVSPEGDGLSCPCHGSSFAPLTGERLGGPAPTGLGKIAVKVVDGQVLTA